MEVIISDANVFVYFYICKLLTKFLSNKKYQIKVTAGVYQEITDKNRRISREYPELRQIILDSSNNHASATHLEKININKITDPFAMKTYYELFERAELDLGEIESIPLSIELGARFLSNDNDAIKEANEIKSGLGISFKDFCKELYKNEIISKADLSAIQQFFESYE